MRTILGDNAAILLLAGILGGFMVSLAYILLF